MLRVVKLLGIGAALVVLAASLWADVALAQDQIAIYRVLPVHVTRDSVLKLAREAFGMDSPTVTEDNTTFMLQQEQKRLTVWKASGAILFADDSKLWNPGYQTTSPASAEEAILCAEAFLKAQNFLPAGAAGALALLHTIKSQDGQSEVNNHWSVNWQLFPEKEPPYTPSPLSSEVKKARLEARIGQGCEILGLHRFWRELGEQRSVPFIPPHHALELVAWKLRLPATPPEGEVGLEGWYDPGFPQDSLSWLYPVYWASLVQNQRPIGVSLPATPFVVLARIVSPQPEQIFQAGTPIELRAEVRSGFGSPPYRYAWYSTVDGLISQASTARVRLSPGLHHLTLIVTDREGTLDSQTIVIAVEAAGQATLPTWPFLLGGAPLVGASLLLRRTRRLVLLILLLGGSFLALSSSAWSQAPVLPNCRAGAAANQYNCTIGAWNFSLAFSANDGLALQSLSYGNHYVAYEFFFPYIEVEFAQAAAAPIVARAELGGGPQAGQVGVVTKPCGAKGTEWRVTNTYTVPLAAVPVNPGAANVALEVTQTWAFYTPAIGCTSLAPEFYPQLEYKLKNLGNLQAGVTFSKVRLFLRSDFDVDGVVVGQKRGAERRDVSVIVRESIFEPVVVAGLTRAQVGRGFYCNWDDNVRAIVGTLNPIAGNRGYVICGATEYGSPTEKVNDFEVYHQADGALVVPLCTAPVISINPPRFFWTPCVHIHQQIGYITGNNQLPGGGLPGAGWMKGTNITQKIYATQYNGAAPQREKEANPDNLMNGQQLTDIVMWLVFEADQPQGLFFPYATRRYPDHYGAFSCTVPAGLFPQC